MAGAGYDMNPTMYIIERHHHCPERLAQGPPPWGIDTVHKRGGTLV